MAAPCCLFSHLHSEKQHSGCEFQCTQGIEQFSMELYCVAAFFLKKNLKIKWLSKAENLTQCVVEGRRKHGVNSFDLSI